MALQDELLTQKIELLLDMQAKKIAAEFQKLRDELSQVKEDLRKEIHSVKQDPSYTQANGANVQMYADAPQHQTQAPEQVPRYAQQQQQQAPQQNYNQGYGQAPQQGYPAQQQYPPQQQQQGYPQQQPQQGYNNPYPNMPAGRIERDAPPVNKPIDRNNVAPSDVSVEKFFYMGGKANKK